MARVALRGEALDTRFAVPGGRAADVLDALERAGLGLARARVAARLGDPDPFHVRAAVARVAAVDPDAPVVGAGGEPLSADAADAVLVAADLARDAAPEEAVAGLFAGRPAGPRVRAVPVDDPRRRWLRWPRGPVPPARIGRVETWSTAEIGDAAVATVRCVEPLPGGGVALGSDYGLTIWRGRFLPFPWPAGARREARRVECMALQGGRLHVGTTQALYAWDLRDTVVSRKHGPDDEGGSDEIACMLAAGERLICGWRTRLEGGEGPRDAIALAADPAGVVYAGTRGGDLHVVDGGGPIRRFVDGKGRPVRHLAWAQGALWVAAAGALHRFDGAAWSARAPEPTALAVDREGRLWALAEGRLHVLEGDALRPLPVALERPWSLGCTPGALWIGGRERVWRVEAR